MTARILYSAIAVLLLAGAISATIPADWAAPYAKADLLYVEVEPTALLMPYVGNGFVATLVGSDTQHASGVYNGDTERKETPSHRARIPGTSSITVSNAKLTGSALDLRNAIFLRRSAGDGFDVEQRWYAPRDTPYAIVHEIDVHSSAGGTVELSLSLNSGPPSTDIAFVSKHVDNGTVLMDGKIEVTETAESERVEVAVVYTDVPSSVSVSLQPNGTTTLRFITVVRTSIDSVSDDLGALAVGTFSAAQDLAASGDLYAAHVREWSELWKSGMEVGLGDLQLAQVVNSTQYYQLSAIRADSPWSISSCGLATDAWEGHILWDAEMWMYPTMTLFHPHLVVGGGLQYRFNTLAGAAKKAAARGWKGTQFAWESAFTGEEMCEKKVKTGQMEDHITADIVLGIRQLWWMQRNSTWLMQIGWPIIKGAAEFWTSRVVASPPGYYSINRVVPPDEYAIGVDNSVFTNVAASMALDFAVQAAYELGKIPPPEWADIASKLVIEYDPHNKYHPEYAGYRHGKTIKQADVVLLGFPLDMEMDPIVRKNDLDAYTACTDEHGPAMSWSMYFVAAMELGDPDGTAGAMFNRSYASAFNSGFLVWTEQPDGGASPFLTGQGGYRQSLWAGFAGLRIRDEGLTFLNPQPVTVRSNAPFVLRGIAYMGNFVDVRIEQDSVSITIDVSRTILRATPLYAKLHDGRVQALSRGVTFEFDRQPFVISFFS